MKKGIKKTVKKDKARIEMAKKYAKEIIAQYAATFKKLAHE